MITPFKWWQLNCMALWLEELLRQVGHNGRVDECVRVRCAGCPYNKADAEE